MDELRYHLVMKDSPMNDIRIGIIGGSGLGDVLNGEQSEHGNGEYRSVDTPFGSPSSEILLTQWHDTPLAILQRHGPGHLYNPSRVPYRANIFALKKCGVTHIIASGATGSLREDIHPGDLVIPDQLIDKTTQRPTTFYDHAAVHVEFAEPFCPVMRCWLMETANPRNLPDVKIHPKGTYICMEGPSFSTRAESEMHRQWGGDLIGMTICPEAKLAREAEIPYALIAMPTDYDCWRPHDPNTPQLDLLEEIISNLQTATQRNIQLIKKAIEDISILRENPCPAHDALKLGIWSDKSKIDPDEITRLSPLWGRYFS